MKNLTITMVLTLLLTTIGSAQIQPNRVKVPTRVDPKIDWTNVNSSLDLEKIKKHIADGKYCYTVVLSSVTLFKPKGNLVYPFDARFQIRNYLKVTGNSLQANGVLLRGDKGYRNGDNFTVFVNASKSDRKKVDKYGVFITWDSSDVDSRTQQIKDVVVKYKPNGILITGNYEDSKGQITAISMILSPQSCLI